MSIRMYEKYPGRTEPSTPEYPGGAHKNASTGTAYDGTPYEEQWANDMWGFLEALMREGSVGYSGNPDNALVSDRMTALFRLFAPYATYTTASYTGGVYTISPESGIPPLDYKDGLYAVLFYHTNNDLVNPTEMKIGSLPSKPIHDYGFGAVKPYRLLRENVYLFYYSSLANKFYIAASSGNNFPRLELSHQQTSGTTGGVIPTTPGYIPRKITHSSINIIPGATITFYDAGPPVEYGHFTLPIGRYKFRSTHCLSDMEGGRVTLRNITLDQIVLFSHSYHGEQVADSPNIMVRLDGELEVINAAHEWEFRCYGTQASVSPTNMGNPASTPGINELYMQTFIEYAGGLF